MVGVNVPTDYELNLYAARVRLNLDGMIDHKSSGGVTVRGRDRKSPSAGKAITPPEHIPDDLRVEWRDYAACLDADGDWFDVPNYSLKGQRNHCAALIGVCSECPVRVECLEYAMEFNLPHGIFGGLLPKERRSLRRRRAGGTTSDKCGTEAGYAQHRRNNESQCEDCKRANRVATERRRRG